MSKRATKGTMRELTDACQGDVFRLISWCMADALVHPGTRLIDDLHMDEVDLIDLSFELQARFDIPVPPEAVEGWVTAADVARFVMERAEG
jgi:acyl carrier protein